MICNVRERYKKEKSVKILVRLRAQEKKFQKKKKVERKGNGKVCFYAKESDVRVAYFAKQPSFVLVYKEACLITNELNPSLPSAIDYLL